MSRDTQEYLDDIKEIRKIMDRSSRFISLSGMSGVSSGIIALIAAYLVYVNMYDSQNYFQYRHAILTKVSLMRLLVLAVATILLSVGLAYFFTFQKAKKNGQKMWDVQARRMLINLLIPLISGGVLCLIFLLKGFVGIVAPLTLIFYGLALVNASKYTLVELRSLGIIEIILGLVSAYFIGYGLVFWALGFGVMHIAYGLFMHFKYS